MITFDKLGTPDPKHSRVTTDPGLVPAHHEHHVAAVPVHLEPGHVLGQALQLDQGVGGSHG